MRIYFVCMYALSFLLSNKVIAAYNTSNTNPDTYGHAQCWRNGGWHTTSFKVVTPWNAGGAGVNEIYIPSDAKKGDVIAKGRSPLFNGPGTNPGEVAARPYTLTNSYMSCKTAGHFSFYLVNNGKTKAPDPIYAAQGWYQSATNKAFYYRMSIGRPFEQGGALPVDHENSWITSHYNMDMVPQNSDISAPVDTFGNRIYEDDNAKAYNLTYQRVNEKANPTVYWEVMLADPSLLGSGKTLAIRDTYFQWGNVLSGWYYNNSQPWVEKYGNIGFDSLYVQKKPCGPNPIAPVTLPDITENQLMSGAVASPATVTVSFTCDIKSDNVYWGVSLIPDAQGQYIETPPPALGGDGLVPVNAASTAKGIAVQVLNVDGVTPLKLVDQSNISVTPDTVGGPWKNIGTKTAGVHSVSFKARPVRVGGQPVTPGSYTATAYFLMQFK
ncbi:MAG: fimbrial protein [Aeromonas veronii]